MGLQREVAAFILSCLSPGCAHCVYKDQGFLLSFSFQRIIFVALSKAKTHINLSGQHELEKLLQYLYR